VKQHSATTTLGDSINALLTTDGRDVLSSHSFDLSSMRSFAVAWVAGHHPVLLQRVQIAALTRALVPHYAFFSAHLASAASCSFFGSFRCSSHRNLNRGPFDLFLHPG
jgi:hypothetical protein